MRIHIIRHGLTHANLEHRYQGETDAPLCPEGRERLKKADFTPQRVFASPLRRAGETAQVLFPGAEPIEVSGLAEMRFGIFEGHTWRELSEGPFGDFYQKWIDSGGTLAIPGGESRAEFCERVCAAFDAAVRLAEKDGLEEIAFLAHGGTQMAVMERFALPERDYYSWNGRPGEGFVLETVPGLCAERRFRLLYREDFSVPLKGEEEC